MAKKRNIPDYSKFVSKGIEYYRTRITNADGKRVSLYGKTKEELFHKVLEAKKEIDDAVFRKKSPKVFEYCEKWLQMHSINIRTTTLDNYRAAVRRYIVPHIGNMYMASVTSDDIKMTLASLKGKSASVYHNVHMLLKCIFESAEESKIITASPCKKVSGKGGKQQEDREPLTDDQVEKLLSAIKGLPPYVFVMLGLYAGLRREESLALQWDSVYLDCSTPYITVRRAWHPEHNRPVILPELKTSAAHRDIPIPQRLVDCLKEVKAKTNSDYVVSNKDGGPLSYTQFKGLWQYILRRSIAEHKYYKYVNGERIVKVVKPSKGQHATNNGHVIYTLDFHVTTHQLRHTYITNLIHASVDPKTVQYLAGHKNSKITMDIYAKVKYNRPDMTYAAVCQAFSKSAS